MSLLFNYSRQKNNMNEIKEDSLSSLAKDKLYSNTNDCSFAIVDTRINSNIQHNNLDNIKKNLQNI
jgi:hypothetical protein